MKLQLVEDLRTHKGSSQSFSGTAWQQTLAVGDAPNPLHVACVTFEPGAGTVWHAHSHGRILVATAGLGRYQSEGQSVLALKPGDSVVIAPCEKHWHGAAPDQLFTHTSIQAADDQGQQAVWMEAVSDRDYTRTPEVKK